MNERAQAFVTPIWAWAVVVLGIAGVVVWQKMDSALANTDPNELSYVCAGFWGCGPPLDVWWITIGVFLTIGAIAAVLTATFRYNREIGE